MPLFKSTRGLFHSKQWNIIHDQVDIATSEKATTENIAVFLDISDLANVDMKSAKLVADSIVERLKTQKVKGMTFALSLLDTCIKNSRNMVEVVGTKDFMGDYYRIIHDKKTEESIRLRMLGFLQEWINGNFSDATLWPYPQRIFEKLKLQGYAFPLPDDEVSATLHSPRNITPTGRRVPNNAGVNSPYPSIRRMRSAPPSAMPMPYYPQQAYFVPANSYQQPYQYAYAPSGTMLPHPLPTAQTPFVSPYRSLFDANYQAANPDRQRRMKSDAQIVQGQLRVVGETLAYASVDEDPSKNDILQEFIPQLRQTHDRLIGAIQKENNLTPTGDAFVKNLLDLSEDISKTLKSYDELMSAYLRNLINRGTNLPASDVPAETTTSAATLVEATELLSGQPPNPSSS